MRRRVALELPHRTAILDARAEYPRRIDFADRRRRAVDLSTAGLLPIKVALDLAADPAINARELHVRGGYGWKQYRNREDPPPDEVMIHAVSTDMVRSLEMMRAMESRSSEMLYEQDMLRLDQVVTAMWPKAMQGSHWHAKRIIEVVELHGKMNNWLSEKRLDVEGAKGIGPGSHSAESEQPDWEAPGFMHDVLDALREAELMTEATFDAAIAALPAAVIVDADVLDVEPDTEHLPVHD